MHDVRVRVIEDLPAPGPDVVDEAAAIFGLHVRARGLAMKIGAPPDEAEGAAPVSSHRRGCSALSPRR
jgi:hypothetical protein